MASEIPPQRSSLGPVSVHRGTVIALRNQLSFGTDQEGTPPLRHGEDMEERSWGILVSSRPVPLLLVELVLRPVCTT